MPNSGSIAPKAKATCLRATSGLGLAPSQVTKTPPLYHVSSLVSCTWFRPKLDSPVAEECPCFTGLHGKSAALSLVSLHVTVLIRAHQPRALLCCSIWSTIYIYIIQVVTLTNCNSVSCAMVAGLMKTMATACTWALASCNNHTTSAHVALPDMIPHIHVLHLGQLQPQATMAQLPGGRAGLQHAKPLYTLPHLVLLHPCQLQHRARIAPFPHGRSELQWAGPLRHLSLLLYQLQPPATQIPRSLDGRQCAMPLSKFLHLSN